MSSRHRPFAASIALLMPLAAACGGAVAPDPGQGDPGAAQNAPLAPTSPDPSGPGARPTQADGGAPSAMDGGCVTADGGAPAEDGGWTTEDGGWPAYDGGSTDDGGWPTLDGGGATRNDAGEPTVPPASACGASATPYTPIAPVTAWKSECASPQAPPPASRSPQELMVGRWRSCGGEGALFGESAPVIDVDGSLRYRILDVDATGAPVPVADAKRVGWLAFPASQVDFNTYGGGGMTIAFVSFPDADTMRIDASPGGVVTYARDAVPAAGIEVAPPLRAGRCSLVGAWDVVTDDSGRTSTASFLFDAEGHWSGGSYGNDVCSTAFMGGSYDLTPQMFEITSGTGMGLCQDWYNAGYSITFDATCTHATVKDVYDNCTGGRPYFTMSATMVKRP